MNDALVRGGITMLVALMIAYQASRARPGSKRRTAFAMSAAAFLLLSLSNIFAPALQGLAWLATLVVGVALALFMGSMVSLLLAAQAGEFRGQMQEARDYIARERERNQRKEQQ